MICTIVEQIVTTVPRAIDSGVVYASDKFTEIFKLNKNTLSIMSLQVSNNELAITTVLQLVNTGPVFNSLLLSKYVPSVFSEQIWRVAGHRLSAH